jgi:hypothetical protein
MGEVRSAYRFLVWKPEGKRPFGSPNGWGESMKMDLTELGWGGMDWVYLGQDTDRWSGLVNAAMNVFISGKSLPQHSQAHRANL